MDGIDARAVRIRKLAKELEVPEDQLLGLLRRLGHTRYSSGEQMLPEALLAQVRRHAPELRKAQPKRWEPPPDEGPVRNLDRVKPTPPSPEEADVLRQALGGVQRLGAAPPAARAPARPEAPRPSPRLEPARPVRVEALRPGPSVEVHADELPDPATRPLPPNGGAAHAGAPSVMDAVLRRVEEMERLLAERTLALGEARARLAELDVDRVTARMDRTLALGERDGARAELEGALAQVDALRSANEALEARVGAVERQFGGRGQEAPVGASLRQVLEARGLRGDDEMERAFVALADARRLRELLDLARLADAAPLERFFDERLILVGQGLDAPPGIPAVKVAPERSEVASTPALKAALTRLSTVLMVNGHRRLVVAGGRPAHHRALRDGLDPRIELRSVLPPYSSRVETISHGVIVLWGDAADDTRLLDRFPNAICVPAKELLRLCAVVQEHVERG